MTINFCFSFSFFLSYPYKSVMLFYVISCNNKKLLPLLLLYKRGYNPNTNLTIYLITEKEDNKSLKIKEQVA